MSTALVLLRRDLRLADHAALSTACTARADDLAGSRQTALDAYRRRG